MNADLDRRVLKPNRLMKPGEMMYELENVGDAPAFDLVETIVHVAS